MEAAEKAETGGPVVGRKMSLATRLVLVMLRHSGSAETKCRLALLNWVVHDIEPPILRSGAIWTFYDEGSGPTLAVRREHFRSSSNLRTILIGHQRDR